MTYHQARNPPPSSLFITASTFEVICRTRVCNTEVTASDAPVYIIMLSWLSRWQYFSISVQCLVTPGALYTIRNNRKFQKHRQCCTFMRSNQVAEV